MFDGLLQYIHNDIRLVTVSTVSLGIMLKLRLTLSASDSEVAKSTPCGSQLGNTIKSPTAGGGPQLLPPIHSLGLSLKSKLKTFAAGRGSTK